MNVGEAMAGATEETPAGTSGSADKPKSDGKREVSRVEIEPSDNGGFVIREFYRQGKKGDMSYMEPSIKTASSLDDLKSMLGDCLDCG